MEYLYCFLIGGVICTVGQILIDTTKLTAPRILVLFVVVGVILGGIGCYEPIIEIAGQGASVPLPGFGYALVTGAIDGFYENGFLGLLSGALSATSIGICVAIVFGYIVALLFNPKSPK